MSVKDDIGRRSRAGTEQARPLFGRTQELDAVAALLCDPGVRLVTLTGPGGVGKTRLARALADDAAEMFGDGVAFVPLASIDDTAHVVSAVGRELGVREEGDGLLLHAIRAELGGLEFLLVLDNFEHVLDAATVVADLLDACPSLTVLVTSRGSLRLSGEHEYPVDPLPLPATTSAATPEELLEVPSVALFVRRAEMAVPGFRLTTENAREVAAICARLDGVPLALQLAAGGLKLLTPEQMLHRLDRPLDVLVGGQRDLPERQQTLRQTLDWSYGLLDPAEQRVFARLAVFSGGATPEAAEAVVSHGGDAYGALPQLLALVDKSLLRRRETDLGEARLDMLQTIRAFALERLRDSGEEPAIRAAHADWYLALAEDAAPAFRFGADEAAIDRVEAEHDNLRGALRWCVDGGDAVRAIRLGAALARFWLVRRHLSDGRVWLDEVLALDAGAVPPGPRARALSGAGLIAHFQNRYDEAVERFEESLSLARAVGDREAVMTSLSGLATTVGRHKDPAAARAMYTEAIGIAGELGDDAGAAALRLALATVLWYQGDTSAGPLLRQSLTEAEALGLAYESAGARQILGWQALADGALSEARAQLEAAAAAFSAQQDRWGVARCRLGLGYTACAAKDVNAARSHFAECLRIVGEVGHKLITCACLGGLAVAAAAEGRAERAATLFGAATATRRQINAKHSRLVQDAQTAGEDAARTALGDAVYADAFAAGERMGIDAAKALAEREAAEGDRGATAAGVSLAELRVLRLVAGGMTNAQVAAELVVSERTVHAHLRTIFRKLGVGNRAAATAFAIEHGLLGDG